jgi:transcription elongation GreA/GreB family factor
MLTQIPTKSNGDAQMGVGLDSPQIYSQLYDHGGWHDNGAWETIDRERAINDGLINNITAALSDYALIEELAVSGDAVSIGTRVTFTSLSGEQQYLILGPFDADVDNGIISHEAPIAQALMGKRVGDTAEFRGRRLIITTIERWEGLDGNSSEVEADKQSEDFVKVS